MKAPKGRNTAVKPHKSGGKPQGNKAVSHNSEGN